MAAPPRLDQFMSSSVMPNDLSISHISFSAKFFISFPYSSTKSLQGQEIRTKGSGASLDSSPGLKSYD